MLSEQELALGVTRAEQIANAAIAVDHLDVEEGAM